MVLVQQKSVASPQGVLAGQVLLLAACHLPPGRPHGPVRGAVRPLPPSSTPLSGHLSQ